MKIMKKQNKFDTTMYIVMRFAKYLDSGSPYDDEGARRNVGSRWGLSVKHDFTVNS